MKVGDRVLMRYGPGTIVEVVDEVGSLYDLYMVHADLGQAWLCTREEFERSMERALAA